MNRVVLVGVGVLLFFSVFLVRGCFRREQVGAGDPAKAVAERSEAFRPVESRGRKSAGLGGTNQGELLMSVPSAAVADGDWILSSPFVEPQLVVWAFTNAGASVSQAKGLMRTALQHLYAGAVYKERISQSEVKELEEIKSVRENESYNDRDKIGFMIVKAKAYQVTRQRWITERDEWMEEFTSWVTSLGVKDPVALKNDLLLIQPANPPPDPKPAE
jgi:hypothetical protein